VRRRELIAGLGRAVAAAAWTYAAHRVRALHLKILRLQANTAADKIASSIGEIAANITTGAAAS
jgi:hypothetical protein